jgi:NIMA (never in mitosis gene a)-related kinase
LFFDKNNLNRHDKRIMHRDLKPANIFIANDGSLKVGDLGLGRVFSSETIEAYSKVGTPLYMSPELLHGEGYDMKSDVWSLGCVIYELCEFKSPFRNENEKMSLMDLFTNITKGKKDIKKPDLKLLKNKI